MIWNPIKENLLSGKFYEGIPTEALLSMKGCGTRDRKYYPLSTVGYFDIISCGYEENKMDYSFLIKAVKESIEKDGELR